MEDGGYSSNAKESQQSILPLITKLTVAIGNRERHVRKALHRSSKQQ